MAATTQTRTVPATVTPAEAWATVGAWVVYGLAWLWQCWGVSAYRNIRHSLPLTLIFSVVFLPLALVWHVARFLAWPVVFPLMERARLAGGRKGSPARKIRKAFRKGRKAGRKAGAALWGLDV